MPSWLTTALVTNWKTTAAGVGLLVVGVLNQIGVHIPGTEAITVASALPGAIGLIVAQDAKAQIGGVIGSVVGSVAAKK